MKRMPVVFVDSDVIISSLLSQRGAAFLVMNHADITRYVSNSSILEQKIVVARLHIEPVRHNTLIQSQCKTIHINSSQTSQYVAYVNDENDAHIVHGAVQAQASFLVSYNKKDFKINTMQHELGVRVISPGYLLQYLRST